MAGDKAKSIPHTGGVDGHWIYEQVYDPELDKHSFLIWDTQKLEAHTALNYEVTLGKNYVPWVTDFVTKGILFLPSRIEEFNGPEELWLETRAFLNRYLDIPAHEQTLNVQYIAMSWVYDQFEEIPYRRFLGDWGTGKSRALEAVGLLCYKPTLIRAAHTPASLFRLIERTQGTILLDEAQFSQKSDMWSAVIQVLNAGYQKRGGVIRCKDSNYSLEAHRVYGPKLLATRTNFGDPALESRCLTAIMQETDRPDIPLNLDSQFYEEALHLRNQWLFYRFLSWPHVILNLSISRVPNISARLRQIATPLASVGESEVFMREYVQLMQKEIYIERQGSFEGKVLAAILHLFPDHVGEEVPLLRVGEIAEQYKQENQVERFTPQFAGRIIRRLGFETKRGGPTGAYCLVWDQALLERHCQRYGFAEDYEALFRGEAQKVQKVQKVQSSAESTEVTELTELPRRTPGKPVPPYAFGKYCEELKITKKPDGDDD